MIKKFTFIFICLSLLWERAFAATPVEKHTIKSLEELVPLVGMKDVLFLDLDETLRNIHDDAPGAHWGSALERIRSKGTLVLGLTQREEAMSQATRTELKEANIQLSESLKIQEIFKQYFIERLGLDASAEASFKDGVLYAGCPQNVPSQKGIVLKAFLDFFRLSKVEQMGYTTFEAQTGTRILNSARMGRIHLVGCVQADMDAVGVALSSEDYEGLVCYRMQRDALASVAPQKLFESPEADFPETICDFKFTGKTLCGGGGGVHIVESPAGDIFTLKVSSGGDAFKEELVADALILASGAHAPAFAIYNHRPEDPALTQEACPSDRSLYRLARFIEEHPHRDDNAVHEALRQRFLWDVLFSNWDVVAHDCTNVILSTDGLLYSIDHGGCLRYRAQGERKNWGWEPRSLSELKTMRDSQHSYMGAQIYGQLTDEALKAQAQALYARSKDVMKELVRIHSVLKINNFDELRDCLHSRFEDLYQRFLATPEESDSGLLAHGFDAAQEGKTSAGIFVYTYFEGEAYTLLGQRIGHKWWGNFGGKSDKGDRTLAVTASRETLEESKDLIEVSPHTLSGCASHDLITQDQRFRMYFAPYSYIEAKTLKDAPVYGLHSEEYTDYIWVKVKTLLETVIESAVIEEENTQTVVFQAPADPKNPEKRLKKVIVHPPLFHMLRQKPVLRALQKLVEGKTLRSVHTSGRVEALVSQKIEDIELQRDKDIRTTWAPVDISNPHTHAVALGHNAAGSMTTTRTLKVDGQAVETDKRIHLSGAAHKETLNQAIHAKARTLVQFKKEGVSLKDRSNRSRRVYGESVTAYTSRKNEALKSRLEGMTYTQSEAHLKALMGNAYVDPNNVPEDSIQATIEDNITRFLTEHSASTKYYTHKNNEFSVKKGQTDHPFVQCMTQAWLEERKPENKAKIFAYHASNANVGILYDIFTELRRQLCIVGLQDGLIVRALDDEFAQLFSAKEFLDDECIRQGVKSDNINDNLVSHRLKATSCNAFIFGNDFCPGECTANYAFSSRSINAPQACEILQYPMGRLGVKVTYNRFERLVRTLEGCGSGRLFQFIFEPEVAQDMIYAAQAWGKTHENAQNLLGNPEGDFSPLRFIEKVRQEATYEKELDFQLRVLMQPRVFGDSSQVRVKQYWAQLPEASVFERYQEELKLFVSEKVEEFLKNDVLLSWHEIHSIGADKHNQTPLQRLAAYVQEGTCWHTPSYRSQESRLFETLSKGDEETLLRLIERLDPQMFVLYKPYADTQGKTDVINPLEQIILKDMDRAYALLKSKIQNDIIFDCHLRSILLGSIYNGTRKTIEKILSKGLVDINERYEFNHSLISNLLETALGQVSGFQTIDVLLDHGADASFVNADNIRDLFLASFSKTQKTSEFLLRLDTQGLSSESMAQIDLDSFSTEEINKAMGDCCTNLFALTLYASRQDRDETLLQDRIQEFLTYCIVHEDLCALDAFLHHFADRIDLDYCTNNKTIPPTKCFIKYYERGASELAAHTYNEEMIKIFIRHGFVRELLHGIVSLDENEDTIEMFEGLLRLGLVDINSVEDEWGETFLWSATNSMHPGYFNPTCEWEGADLEFMRKVVFILLKNGADPNVKRKGECLLDVAVACEDAWLFGALIHAGADVSQLNTLYANSCKNKEIRSYLNKLNLNPYARKAWKFLRKSKDTVRKAMWQFYNWYYFESHKLMHPWVKGIPDGAGVDLDGNAQDLREASAEEGREENGEAQEAAA